MHDAFSFIFNKGDIFVPAVGLHYVSQVGKKRGVTYYGHFSSNESVSTYLGGARLISRN